MSRPTATFRGGGSIRDAFQELKQRGPQVLVTGDVPETVSQQATRRLLGHPAERRHRVLALTDSAEASAEWFPGECSPADDGVVLLGEHELRGSAVVGDVVDGADDEDTLVRRVDEEISHWQPADAPPPPAVLRVGVYSLETVLETHGIEAVRDLAYRLTGEVRRSRGMGHYHLPREAGAEAVEDLQFVFDAQLELRTAPAGAEQRWHLPGRGTTGWAALGEP
ncbi:MAG: DUF7504 family protein [archaeon]